MTRVRKAVIPAAGLGTRNLPVTKVVPKELFPVGNKPAIHYVVEEAVAAGIDAILLVVSRGKEALVNYFDRASELEHHLEQASKGHLRKALALPPVHVQFVRQQEPKGLGDAVRLAKPFVGDEPFAVLLPDDLLFGPRPALAGLLEAYAACRAPVVALKVMPDDVLHRYGVARVTPAGDRFKIEEIVEKPREAPPSNYAVIGRYVLTPDLFPHLEALTPGVGGELQLTDALRGYLAHGSVYGVPWPHERYDVSLEREYVALLHRFLTQDPAAETK